MRQRQTLLVLTGLGVLVLARALAGQEASRRVTINKAGRSVAVPCKIAPRKLPNLDRIYPLEVVACWPAPKGQKAHETVVIFDVKPSEVHKALESLGLKPGKSAVGENGKASGPEVQILLELPGGKAVPIEETMVDMRSGKPLSTQTWLFTGSAIKYPDPEKDDKAYGADITGTLITIFPISDDTVFQSTLGKKDEGTWRLETNKALLPMEGTAVKMIIKAR